MKISNDIRIIIVEDDPVQAQVLQDKLLEFNPEYNLQWFKRGEELLKFFKNGYKKNKFNYVILDYYLQTKENSEVLNGYDIIKQLWERFPKVKIILFSAYENDDDTDFKKIKEEPNVIDFVKKSDHAYSSLQNIFRFDFSQNTLAIKRKRFRIVFAIFVVLVVFASFYFLSTNFFI